MLACKFALLRLLGRRVPLRGRDRLIRLLEDPGGLRDFQFVEEFHGFAYPGNLKRFIDWSVFFYGAYSGHELTLLGDLAVGIRAERPGPLVAWDIGANIGHHTLFLASVADRVISFEPVPHNAALVREKLAFNGIETVELQQLALGEEAGELPLHHPDFEANANFGTASLHADYSPDNNVHQTVVRIAVGDDYRAERNLPAPDIIKIDVEGFERPALAGLSKTIREAAPAVLMETSPYTWNSFPSPADLEAVLPDMEFFELRATADPMAYRAAPLRFGISEEIFAIPRSRTSLSAAFAPASNGVIGRPRILTRG
jgi:FkbM family methyltransferase